MFLSNPVQSSKYIHYLSKKRASAYSAEIQTSNQTAQWLQMAARKSSELIAIKVCSQIGCKWNAIFEIHVVTSVDRMSFDFDFKIFWAICLCKQSSSDWSTIHNLILKICPKFKFSVLTFLGSINCLMSNEQKLCLVKKFQLQSMSNAITYIDKRFTVNNSGISCLARLALIFTLSNQQTCTLKNLFMVARRE